MKYLHEQQYVNKEIIIGIRPENIHDDPAFIFSSAETKIDAKIEVAELTGAETIVHSRIDDQSFIARINSPSDLSPNESIHLAFEMSKAHFFDKETETRIRPSNSY